MRRLAFLLAMAIVFGAAAVTRAQDHDKTVFVPYGLGEANGYSYASVQVRYRFIACAGEVHIAYSLEPEQIRVSPTYQLNGQTLPAPDGAPPRPVTAVFAGRVMDGPVPIGTFSDGLAGPALGMGCFSGQSQKIGMVKDLVGARTAPEQVAAFLARLTAAPRPMPRRLTSAAVESKLGEAARRAEAEKRELARKAQEEDRAKEAERLARERKRMTESERALADAKAVEDKAKAAREALERLLAETDEPSPEPAAPMTAKLTEDQEQVAATEPAESARGTAELVASPGPADIWTTFCYFGDRTDSERVRDWAGAKVYVTDAFEVDASRFGAPTKEALGRILTEAWRTHIRATHPVHPKAFGDGCWLWRTAEEARRERARRLESWANGREQVTASLYAPVPRWVATPSDWRPTPQPPTPARTKISYVYCTLQDRLDTSSSREYDGLPAFITEVFEIDETRLPGLPEKQAGEVLSEAFKADARSRHAFHSGAMGGCVIAPTAEEVAQQRQLELQAMREGRKQVTSSIWTVYPRYRHVPSAWRPTLTPVAGEAPTPKIDPASVMVPDAPAEVPQPASAPAAEPAAAEAARIAELRARDEAEAAAGAARLKAYHDGVEAQRAAHEAEVARLQAANAEALRRHAEAVAETNRRNEQALADWRARVAACRAGDRSKCASR